MKLHLGVIDVPYTNGKKPVTTADVARWLEKKYKIMETFGDLQLPAIAFALEESLAGEIENLMLGAPAANDPFLQATDEIDQMFRTFLDENEMAFTGIPGVPTKASLNGVNNRFKKKKQTGSRPSFIDTGLYRKSFKSWMG